MIATCFRLCSEPNVEPNYAFPFFGSIALVEHFKANTPFLRHVLCLVISLSSRGRALMTNFCTPLHRTLSAHFKCERETYSWGTASSQATWHVRKHPHKWANIQKHLISVSYISIVSLSRCNARCLIQITQRQRKTSKQHVNLANEEEKKELPWMQPRCAAVSFWRLVLIPAGIFLSAY